MVLVKLDCGQDGSKVKYLVFYDRFVERTPVVSSNLDSVGYDPATRTLEIEFKNGSVYQYSGVPESVYLGLMSASSKGSYHSQFVKNSYPYRRVA